MDKIEKCRESRDFNGNGQYRNGRQGFETSVSDPEHIATRKRRANLKISREQCRESGDFNSNGQVRNGRMGSKKE